MKDASKEFTDPSQMSYEEARDELTRIVANLEAGTDSLDESLNLWERGEALAKRCGEWLDAAQARLDGKPADSPHNEQSDSGATTHQAPADGAASSAEPVQQDPFARDTKQAAVSAPPPPPPDPGAPNLRPVPNPGPQTARPATPRPTDPPW